MTRTIRGIGLAGVLLVMAGQADAQWPDYPTRNVPRTADGEVDMAAPAPRTIDGHVDFTGIWAARFGGPGAGGRGGRGGRGGPPEQGLDADAAEEPSDSPPVATFGDIGRNIEGGAPYTDWGREIKEERMARNMQDNPDAHCLPMGHMQFHLHPQPREMIQTEDIIVILYEGNAGIRQIYLDGRPSPDDNPLPWWYGYSTGHWEGDELVVVTTHMKDDGWLDVNGSPFTSQGTITERFRRPSYGYLEIDVTIEDPVAYTEPFTVRVNQQILVDTSLIEFVCQENEQSSDYYSED
jgi:hypothetical protein